MFRKIVISCLLAIVLCCLTLSSSAYTLSQVRVASAHASASCGGGNCDGRDPVATGCSAGASHLGIISGSWEDQNNYSHNQILFSNACQSNYGYVSSVNGQPLVVVAIFRADQSGKYCNSGGCTVDGLPCFGATGCDFLDYELPQNSGNVRFYCGVGGPHCDNTIPNGATTWETDMLYSPTAAPNQEVQLCQLPANAAKFYCSAWH